MISTTFLSIIIIASRRMPSSSTTSNWITVNHNFINTPSNVTAISVPCFIFPEKDEIERKGFPTF
jgi:hypothetical protein